MDATENTVMFCADQIVVPPQLPEILKEFAKEAIRNEVDLRSPSGDCEEQEKKLLTWCLSYFIAMKEKAECKPST